MAQLLQTWHVIGENPPKHRTTLDFGRIMTWDSGQNMSVSVNTVNSVDSVLHAGNKAGKDQFGHKWRLTGALVRD
jgi:hypothetical protein